MVCMSLSWESLGAKDKVGRPDNVIVVAYAAGNCNSELGTCECRYGWGGKSPESERGLEAHVGGSPVGTP